MTITEDMTRIAYKKKWDLDILQELWCRLIETPEPNPPVEKMENWLTTRYHHLRLNLIRNTQRREELLRTEYESVSGLVTEDDSALDPLEILIADEEINRRMDGLSDALAATLASHLKGRTTEELALEFKTTTDVMYKRLQRAKEEIKGDNNDGRQQEDLSRGVHITNR